MRETTKQTPRSVKKEGEEVLQALEQRFPVATEKAIVAQLIPLQPMEVYHEVNCYPASHGGPPATAGGDVLREVAVHAEPPPEQTPDRNCGPWRESHTGAGFLSGPMVHRGPALEQFIPEGLQPLEGTRAGAWGGPTLEKFVKDCLLWEGPHPGAGEEDKKEGVAETMCDDLTTAPDRATKPLKPKHILILSG